MTVGYIAEPGADQYRHLFGGMAWTMVAPAGASPAPTLLLTLDLGDPRLAFGRSSGTLPLCAHLHDGSNLERQHYSFDPVLNRIAFDGPAWQADTDPDYYLPNPLPQHPLCLRPLREAEDLRVTDKYDVQDTFLGDVAFLRVGGEPLWLQHAGGSRALHVVRSRRRWLAWGTRTNPILLDSSPLRSPSFSGNSLYFFACFGCNRVAVLSQST